MNTWKYIISGCSIMLKFPFGCAGVTLKCIGASMGEKQPLAKKLPPTTTVNIPLDPQYSQ